MAVDGRQASEGWLNQMIAEARRQGTSLCVRVEIQQPPVHIVLATAGCGGSGGGGRPPNDAERRLFEAWRKRGLSTGEFSPGQLRAFLNDIERII
jgi:hypothetical protein